MEFNVKYDRSANAPRIVKTVFDLNEANDCVAKGHTVIFQPVQLNDELFSHNFVFKNRNDGQFRIAESRVYFVQYGRRIELPEEEWELVMPVKYYARERSLNTEWAAYVLPLDPKEGEIFYIEDLIEDIRVNEFWSSKIYAVDGVAEWNGHELEFRRDLYKESECMIMG
jgi:hypothetical protein